MSVILRNIPCGNVKKERFIKILYKNSNVLKRVKEGDKFNADWFIITINFTNGESVILPYELCKTNIKNGDIITSSGTNKLYTVEYKTKDGAILKDSIYLDIGWIASIVINTKPTKIKYDIGNKVDYTGLSVLVTYLKYIEPVVKNLNELTVYPPNGSTITDFKDISVNYKSGTNIFWAYFSLDITKPLKTYISSYPKMNYLLNQTFDTNGLEVSTLYSNATTVTHPKEMVTTDPPDKTKFTSVGIKPIKAKINLYGSNIILPFNVIVDEYNTNFSTIAIEDAIKLLRDCYDGKKNIRDYWRVGEKIILYAKKPYTNENNNLCDYVIQIVDLDGITSGGTKYQAALMVYPRWESERFCPRNDDIGAKISKIIYRSTYYNSGNIFPTGVHGNHNYDTAEICVANCPLPTPLFPYLGKDSTGIDLIPTWANSNTHNGGSNITILAKDAKHVVANLCSDNLLETKPKTKTVTTKFTMPSIFELKGKDCIPESEMQNTKITTTSGKSFNEYISYNMRYERDACKGQFEYFKTNPPFVPYYLSDDGNNRDIISRTIRPILGNMDPILVHDPDGSYYHYGEHRIKYYNGNSILIFRDAFDAEHVIWENKYYSEVPIPFFYV